MHYTQLDLYYPWKKVEEITTKDMIYHAEISSRGISHGLFAVTNIRKEDDYVYLTYNDSEFEYDTGDELRVFEHE